MAGGTSYNGWPCSDDPAAIGVDTDWAAATGEAFPGGIRGGDVAVVLGYVIDQWAARVEDLVPGWQWGYSYRENVNSPGSLSCHASASAADVNAPLHGNGGSAYEGLDSAQVATIRDILAEVDGCVQWGADYSGTKDPMHVEIIVDAARLAVTADRLRNNGTGDDQVNDADIQAIADAVMDRIRTQDVVSYNKVDAGSGDETQTVGSVTEALGTAATYSGRAAYRSTKIDNEQGL